MSKNLLSENMLRFGTKNLSERQERELIVKSIMETINQHGLHGEVRSRLMEQSAPGPKDWIEIDTLNYREYKLIDVSKEVNGKFIGEVPLIIQSGTSLGEASKIIGGMMKLVGQENAESDQMITLIKQVSYNNYPAILYKMRKGAVNGKSYGNLSQWLKNYIDSPSTSYTGTGTIGSGGKGPIHKVRDFLMGVEVGDAFNKHMYRFNRNERI